MSLLLSEGHRYASRYALAKVWGEARIVRKRYAARLTTEAVLQQAVIMSCLAKEGGEHLQAVLRELEDG